jgi:hypothetical protein
MRVHKPRTLPSVLSREEVRRALSAIEHPVRRMALTSIYALGLSVLRNARGVQKTRWRSAVGRAWGSKRTPVCGDPCWGNAAEGRGVFLAGA